MARVEFLDLASGRIRVFRDFEPSEDRNHVVRYDKCGATERLWDVNVVCYYKIPVVVSETTMLVTQVDPPT